MRIGILGAGKIANIMARTIAEIDGVVCYAIASRDVKKAEVFAQMYQCSIFYKSYEELLKNPEIDLVYIATPHSHHYEQMKLAISHNKNILCEKAFTVNSIQAKEIISLAKDKRIFVAEAFWTKYIPLWMTLSKLIESKVIGKIYSLTANIGCMVSEVPRVSKSELAGGALLDLSVYPINFAVMVLGKNIESIEVSAIMNENNVDLQNSIILKFAGGELATLHTTTLASTNRDGVIYGEKGYIKVKNVNSLLGIQIFNTEHKLIDEYFQSERITGYEFEVLSAKKAIEAGCLECSEVPHGDTIFIMELMDQIRQKLGMVYLCE